MSKYLFVLSKGPEDPLRAARCLGLAKMAVLRGHQVNVFLTDEAVRYAQFADSQGPAGPGQEEVAGLVRFLCGSPEGLMVCRRSAAGRLGGSAGLPTGVHMAHEMRLLDLAEECKLFTF